MFAQALDDRGVIAFPNEAAAVSYCERRDVESGQWSFFASDGTPLKPVLSNAAAGYVLTPDPSSAADLKNRLASVAYVEGCGISTIEELERHLKATVQGGLR